MMVDGAEKMLVLADQRGPGRYLRLSWHDETRSIVISHWSGDVCTASSRLSLRDATRLVGFVVELLHHAATAARDEVPTVAVPAKSWTAQAFSWVGTFLARAGVTGRYGDRPTASAGKVVPLGKSGAPLGQSGPLSPTGTVTRRP